MFDHALLFFLGQGHNKHLNIMLEKNALYRRMQHHDIFRTFSRTYSRQHHHTPRHHQMSSTPSQFELTEQQLSTSYRPIGESRVFTANDISRRDMMRGSTMPTYMKTEQQSQNCMPFSQTVNLNTVCSKFSINPSNQKSAYLSNTFSKRKASDSLLVNIRGRNKR